MIALPWIICVASLTLLIFILSKYLDAKSKLKKYSPILDIDEEVKKVTKERDKLLAQLEPLKKEFETLETEIKLLNDDYDLTSAGFYKSKYDFGDSKKYEDRLDSIRDKQKEMIKDKSAIVCSTVWTVGGSKKEGKKMVDRAIKLGLSAFNVQCDNEILRVSFSNIDRAEQKIQKIRENVDKLLEPNSCRITEPFYKLKLDELSLAYEYQEQLYKEKEEQRLIKEQMREEEKAQRELERAQADAQREEERYEAALEKAKKDLEKKSDAEKDNFLLKIADLEAKLREAHENKERAMSQAQMTKRGHVYVISNIGSFGEDVFKIGMTRRLDPLDRVKELGDASVPFEFDIHAMVMSEDAPNLERLLHGEFGGNRVNKVNEKKEFFRVSLQEIQNACKKHHGGEFKLTLLAEAKEYRQTVAMSTKKAA